MKTFKKTGIARIANIYLKDGNSTWATIYNLLLKVEVLTWPLCSTRQQPQGSRRSGFRHYPFMRRKNERSISREIVRCIGVKHHLLRLWQEEVHHHWPVLAALVFHLGGNNWLGWAQLLRASISISNDKLGGHKDKYVLGLIFIKTII